MLKTELMEIIANGENSGTEFKRDDIRPEHLAKAMVAFLNLQGGRFLLGVEDDGTISGLQRPDVQEWVLNVFRDKVTPQAMPLTLGRACPNSAYFTISQISPPSYPLAR
jgi:ATP-dependent DNA helicase RecG